MVYLDCLSAGFMARSVRIDHRVGVGGEQFG